MLKVVKPEGVVLVFLALIALFVFTGALANIYRGQRLRRAESHYRTGVQLAHAGRAAQAVEEYRAALTYSHDDNRYQLALVLSLMDLGRLDEAESHLLELHENDPNDALTDLMLARIAARQGRTGTAVTDYHQAIYGLWPDDPSKNRLQARFELIDPPDPGELVTRGMTVSAYDFVARIRLPLPLDEALEVIPRTVGVPAADGDSATIIELGGDARTMPRWLAALPCPCEVLEPPELREALRRHGEALAAANG